MVLAAALVLIMSKATRIFNQVFEKYDDLNASVQENVTAIRVVKAFVREDYENNKFKAAAENLYRLFVKAESRLALNNPIMMLIVYGCMIAISWFGTHQQLLENNKIYQEIYQAQTQGGGDFDQAQGE